MGQRWASPKGCVSFAHLLRCSSLAYLKGTRRSSRLEAGQNRHSIRDRSYERQYLASNIRRVLGFEPKQAGKSTRCRFSNYSSFVCDLAFGFKACASPILRIEPLTIFKDGIPGESVRQKFSLVDRFASWRVGRYSIKRRSVAMIAQAESG